jgi:DNA-binding transcriptional ArsR family regulator
MSVRSTAAADSAHVEPVFAALGDTTRLALVASLCEGAPLSITRLTAGSDLTRQAIRKHLGVLARAGIVSDVRKGRERIWALDPAHLEQGRGWQEEISFRWDRALDRLKKFVQE